jgi:GMP synthase (glutamine-hydrolysing)
VTKTIVLKHIESERPSRILALLAERACKVDIRALYQGDAVPSELAPDELLIVMGGAMGVGDVELPEFPFLRRELDLLRRCVEQGLPVLGICLGAQLLAHAAGAAVHPLTKGQNRVYEVGWGPIRFHGTRDSELLSGIPNETTVLHWHGDTFDLPFGAELLASSETCHNQAFRLGRRQFGLQFHCETTAEDVENWLAEDESYVMQANGKGGVAELRRETAENMATASAVGDRLLRNILQAMCAP